jgi:hypothetical protein
VYCAPLLRHDPPQRETITYRNDTALVLAFRIIPVGLRFRPSHGRAKGYEHGIEHYHLRVAGRRGRASADQDARWRVRHRWMQLGGAWPQRPLQKAFGGRGQEVFRDGAEAGRVVLESHRRKQSRDREGPEHQQGRALVRV